MLLLLNLIAFIISIETEASLLALAKSICYGFKESRKRSVFVIDSHSKNSAFTAI